MGWDCPVKDVYSVPTFETLRNLQLVMYKILQNGFLSEVGPATLSTKTAGSFRGNEEILSLKGRVLPACKELLALIAKRF